MAALLGRKLGMTQVFGEDGRVERVSVVEAGPCHVTGIRTEERDGYEAVQLGFGEVKEKRLTKAELGHLKKADAPALRRLAEFRGEAGELQVGETVTVEVFEKGQHVKVSGTSKGKGFQGTVKRHNFSRGPQSHGSHTPAPQARSAPPPRRRGCSRGCAARGRWGTSAARCAGSRWSTSSPARTSCCFAGPSPARPAGSSRSGAIGRANDGQGQRSLHRQGRE